jgi:hypothetical protein
MKDYLHQSMITSFKAEFMCTYLIQPQLTGLDERDNIPNSYNTTKLLPLISCSRLLGLQAWAFKVEWTSSVYS